MDRKQGMKRLVKMVDASLEDYHVEIEKSVIRGPAQPVDKALQKTCTACGYRCGKWKQDSYAESVPAPYTAC